MAIREITTPPVFLIKSGQGISFFRTFSGGGGSMNRNDIEWIL